MEEEKKDEELLLQRLCFHVNETGISILYRPVHTYIDFVNNDKPGLEKIKELAQMSRDDFKKYLSKAVGLPFINEAIVRSIISNTDAEKWFKGAWQNQTNEILKKLNVKNPIEKPIYTKEL